MKKSFWFILILLTMLAFCCNAFGEVVFAFEKLSYSVDVQKSLTLTPILQGTEKPKNSSYVWESSDPSVAKVSSGTITGVGAGKATITCTLTVENEKLYVASCTVKVVQPVTSIKPQKDVLEIRSGASLKLSPLVMPENATNKELVYSCDGDSISVSSTGLVSAKHLGKATVLMQAADGSGKTAKQVIRVTPFVITTNELIISERKLHNFWVTVSWHGLSLKFDEQYFYPDDSLEKKGTNVYYLACDDGKSNWFGLHPQKPGTTTLTISAADYAHTIKVKIEESACYNKNDFPSLNYTAYLENPDQYIGTSVSVKGKLVRSYPENPITCSYCNGDPLCRYCDGDSKNERFIFEIATKEKNKDIVFVAVPSVDNPLPMLAQGSSVEVYGTYQIVESVTETGLKLPKPYVEPERINNLILKYEEIDVDL